MQKPLMLIVDDDEINRIILRELFVDDFIVEEADNGADALKKIEEQGDNVAMVLLDLVMPVKDGFAVLEEMNRNGLIKAVPVILITGEYLDENILKAYALGASDVANKPYNVDIIQKRVQNIVDLYSYKNNLEHKVSVQTEKIRKQAERIKKSNQFVIDALSTTMEFRSMESGEHIQRVRHFTKRFIESMDGLNLTPEQIEAISTASTMHDIGKIAIPDHILLKPGKLTAEEFEIMKTHTIKGCEILNSINHTQEDREFFTYCYDICRHHHEKWDGSGYPDGLKGDDIPIWAQATALADVYDALMSKRVYKDSFSHEKTVSMITGGECGQFGPHLIEVFLEIQYELKDMVM